MRKIILIFLLCLGALNILYANSDSVNNFRDNFISDSLKQESSNFARRSNFLISTSDDAKTNIGWNLAILGGSIIIFLNEGYIRPKWTKLRIVYLLFIFGWISIGVSINASKNIITNHISATLFAKNAAELIPYVETANENGNIQYQFLYVTLFIFSIWLTTMLILWIATKTELNNN